MLQLEIKPPPEQHRSPNDRLRAQTHLSLCACGHECHWCRACRVQKESWKRIVFLLSFLLRQSRHCRLCCLSHTSLICLLRSSNRVASGFSANLPLHTQELCLCLRCHAWFCVKHACCAPALRVRFSLRALALLLNVDISVKIPTAKLCMRGQA